MTKAKGLGFSFWLVYSEDLTDFGFAPGGDDGLSANLSAHRLAAENPGTEYHYAEVTWSGSFVAGEEE